MSTWTACIIIGLAAIIAYFLLPSSPPSDPPPCAGVSLRSQPFALLRIPNPLSSSDLPLQLHEPTTAHSCTPSGLSLTLPSSHLRLRRLQEAACHILAWTPSQDSELCFLMNGRHLYGGAATFDLRWPSSRQRVDFRPFVSTDLLGRRTENRTSYWGSLLERAWITSDGFFIGVDDDSPLYVALDEGKLCLKASREDAFVHSKAAVEGREMKVEMTVCTARDVKAAHKEFLVNHLGHALDLPDLGMLRRPIWSTWARYHTEITQEKILRFADEIATHNFPFSVLEIDDKFSPAYGDFAFDSHKFPNASAMISDLHTRGFRVTAWITPFANPDSRAFADGVRARAWVAGEDGKPALVRWWQGEGALLDVTSPQARSWFQHRLQDFQRDTHLDGFKFDAGESEFWPEKRFSAAGGARADVNDLATLWAKLVGGVTRIGEVRVGHRSQAVPLFLRMFDKSSAWGENGLKSLIPHALLSAMLGYSYVMPDMIGGNAYDGDNLLSFAPPERELFVRWVQVAAFMPAMQFSLAPWDFDQEVVEIARAFAWLHENVVFEHLKEATVLLLDTGAPILRPLWWIDSGEEAALTAEDQFLVGDCLMVAPVVEKGRTSRDVFLPSGVWRDGNSKEVVQGPKWIRDYPAPLNVTPWFECV